MARQSRYTREGRRQASRGADAVAKLPTNSVLPVITGTTTVGQTLTVTPGTWSNTPDLTYQWLRDGAVITGETGATYLLDAADEGAAISVSEVAVNERVQAVATSAETAAIAAA